MNILCFSHAVYVLLFLQIKQHSMFSILVVQSLSSPPMKNCYKIISELFSKKKKIRILSQIFAVFSYTTDWG
jgi:hypothetical protein